MDYKEHLIVEKWKDVSTDEIIKIKEACKRLRILENEYIIFYILMFLFTSPAFAFMISNFMFGVKFLTILLLIYTPFWFFYFKKKLINKARFEAAGERFEEMDIVLKSRKN